MNHKPVTIILSLLGAAVLGVMLLMLLTAKASSDSCVHQGMAYQVTIRSNQASNTAIQAKMCDTITYTNRDDITREIAFGPHEDHVPYDGIAERVLNKDQSFTIILNKTGTYHWHDHLHDEITGTFSVSQ